MKTSFLIQKGRVHLDAHDVRQEHIMRSHGDDVRHAAAQCQRRFGNQGAGQIGGFLLGQMESGELVHLTSRVDPAGIGGTHQICRGQIDGELPRFLDDLVGVTGGTDGNIGFGRDRVHNAGPGDGDDVGLLHSAAADHHRRDRTKQSAAFPLNFLHTNLCFLRVQKYIRIYASAYNRQAMQKLLNLYHISPGFAIEWDNPVIPTDENVTILRILCILFVKIKPVSYAVNMRGVYCMYSYK